VSSAVGAKAAECRGALTSRNHIVSSAVGPTAVECRGALTSRSHVASSAVVPSVVECASGCDNDGAGVEARKVAALELVQVSRWQLAEVKQMKSPPLPVRQTLEAVWICLGCENVEARGGPGAVLRDGPRAWKSCLRMLADEQFVTRVLAFSPDRLDATPRVAKHLCTLVLGLGADGHVAAVDCTPVAGRGRRASDRSAADGQPLLAEVVSRAHAPCGALLKWMRAMLSDYKQGDTGVVGRSASESNRVAWDSQHDGEVDSSVPNVAVPHGGVIVGDAVRQRGVRNRSPAVLAPIVPSPSPAPALAVAGSADLDRAKLSANVGCSATRASPSPLPRLSSKTRDQVKDEDPMRHACPRASRGPFTIAPPLQRARTRWSDAIDNRPMGIGLQKNSNVHVPQARVTLDGTVNFAVQEPPETKKCAVTQLQVQFAEGSSQVHEQDAEQVAALNRLVALVRPEPGWWNPKLFLEGRRECKEAEGVDVERAIAVYKWLVDRGHMEPGALRLEASAAAKLSERCVAFRPIHELEVVAGPAQAELPGGLPPGLFFDFSSAILTDATLVVVEGLARWLAVEGHEGLQLTVEGHTDRAEKDVSLARARAVQDALAFRGIISQRVHLQACSAWHPRSRSGPGLNRRVELHISVH